MVVFWRGAIQADYSRNSDHCSQVFGERGVWNIRVCLHIYRSCAGFYWQWIKGFFDTGDFAETWACWNVSSQYIRSEADLDIFLCFVVFGYRYINVAGQWNSYSSGYHWFCSGDQWLYRNVFRGFSCIGKNAFGFKINGFSTYFVFCVWPFCIGLRV